MAFHPWKGDVTTELFGKWLDLLVNFINTLRTDADTNATNVATNAADIATNTANVATNTASIGVLEAQIPALANSTATTLSGTATTITGIPSWATIVIATVAELSTNGSSSCIFRIGTSSAVADTGYTGTRAVFTSSAVATVNSSTGFSLFTASSSTSMGGMLVLVRHNTSSNTWIAHGGFGEDSTTRSIMIAGTKTLSAAMDRVQLTTAGGTDTFDAGTMNLWWS